MEELLDKEMDLVSSEDVRTLCRERGGPCVSIFMPTHRVWNEQNQDRIQFKTLLGRAAEQLRAAGDDIDVDAMLADARELLKGDTDFWRHQADTLAVFIAPGEFHRFRLPAELPERVTVGEAFHVRPLVQLLNGSGRFYALSLSKGGVQLYSGSRYRLRQLDIEGVPTSLEESTKYDVYESYQQFHTGTGRFTAGGDRGAMFHGQGDAADQAQVKKQTLEFLRKVDNGVRDQIGDSRLPMVLVGLDHMIGAYREVNHYAQLADEAVAVNPADLSPRELHARIWSVVAPQYNREVEAAMDEYRRLSGNGSERVSTSIEDIANAARYQRVKTLFVRPDGSIHGHVRDDGQKVELELGENGQDEDVLDFVVTHTCRNGGDVFVVTDDILPEGTHAASVYRY